MAGHWWLVAALGIAATLSVPAGQVAAQPRAARIIKHWDADGDGRIAKDEYHSNKRPFSDFDLDDDGYATREEIEAVLGQRPPGNRATGAAGPQGRGAGSAELAGRAMMGELDPGTRNAFLLERVRKDEIARGLIESKLTPVYPADASCPKIDHIFGEHWQGPVQSRRSNATRHHGADIPAPHGTPIVAIADGVVIAKYTGDDGNFQGITVVLRHAPEDTGLPVWLYTVYAHFAAMPALQIGQHLRMGDPLGPTGKTGVTSPHRPDHLHFEVRYSTSDRYVPIHSQIVPVDGHDADVVTLMRRTMPLDTNAMRALPKAERRVAIPYRLTSGATVPPDTKIIWPYACKPH